MNRTTAFIVHGSCGAFLGVLIALGTLIGFDDINWAFVLIAAAFAFLLAGFIGEQGLAWLKEIWRWS
jgi:hypothetical protein